MKFLLVASILSFVAAPLSPALAQGQLISARSILPPESGRPRVHGVSGDGSRVVISDGASYPKFFVWTRGVGLFELPTRDDGGRVSSVEGISHDGSFLTGFYSSPEKGAPAGAFRYQLIAPDYEFLPVSGSPVGISAAGDRILLQAGSLADPSRTVPHIWDALSGVVELPAFAELLHTTANAFSPDGRVVAGGGRLSDGVPAWRWDAATGYTVLHELPGGTLQAIPLACSTDGSVIVGASSSDSNDPPSMEAFHWSVGRGTIPMGDIDGGPHHSNALAVTADGSIALGIGVVPLGFEAFLWSELRGLHRIRDVLAYDHGFDHRAWQWRFRLGKYMSADGTVLVGEGINPRGEYDAWIVILEEPWRCGADFNRDGAADSRDFFEFFRCAFEPTPGCSADFNHDGQFNAVDTFNFIEAFLRGCR